MQTLKSTEKVVFASQRPLKFIVIGCGGTGSYLIRDLARIVSINNRQFGRTDTILLIDGDVVEDKNLARQNFVQSDIGKNKASVMAARHSAAFGIQIGFLPEYLREKNINDAIGDGAYSNVLLSCVDNNKTRHLIHRMYRSYLNGACAFYFDSGNEEFAGQVVASGNTGYTTNGNSVGFASGYGGAVISDAVEHFTLDSNDKHPDELSCAEHSVSAPQNIATNIMAANVMFNYCNDLITSSAQVSWELRDRNGPEFFINFKEKARSIPAHVTFFNSMTGAISTQPMHDEVQKKLKKAREDRESWLRNR